MARIGAVYFRRFRSLLETNLTKCSNLNVLIGTNNSGKSNVLAGIETGLEHLRSGRVAYSWKTRGRAADQFTNRAVAEALQIGIEFEIDSDFNEALRKKLQSETIGLEVAIEQLRECNKISVVIAGIIQSGEAFRCVQEIDCGSVASDGRRLKTERASLFRVTDDVARELIALSRESEQLRSDLAEFDRIVADLTRSFLFRDREGGLPRRISGTSQMGRAIDSILRRNSTPEQFDEGLAQFRVELEGKIDAAEERQTSGTMRSFSGDVRTPPDYVQWIMRELGGTHLLHFRETRSPVGLEEAFQLLQLKTKRGGTQQLGTLQKSVKALLGVNVDAFESELTAGGRGGRAAEMDIDDFLVEANGAGIREAFRIILDLEMKSPNLILIEEPEVHLHPGLERVMHGYLSEKSQQIQMFIATHSTNFIDVSMAQNVYLVGRTPDRMSSVERIVSRDEILKIPAEIGLRPSTVFMFDRLIFVEGATDEAVFREFARKLEVDLTSLNVGFVQMGGASKFAHYAADATIDLLSRRRIKMLFVIDRDERDDSDVEKMIERLGNRACLVVLDRREMENYLLNPSAISDLIKEKRGRANVDELPSADEISDAIVAAAATLKDRVLDLRIRRKLLGPLYLDSLGETNEVRLKVALTQINDRLARLATELSKVQHELDQVWPNQAVNLAPGSQILDTVLGKYGFRYRKEGDAVRLAALMSADEIDKEIAKPLYQIASE